MDKKCLPPAATAIEAETLKKIRAIGLTTEIRVQLILMLMGYRQLVEIPTHTSKYAQRELILRFAQEYDLAYYEYEMHDDKILSSIGRNANDLVTMMRSYDSGAMSEKDVIMFQGRMTGVPISAIIGFSERKISQKKDTGNDERLLFANFLFSANYDHLEAQTVREWAEAIKRTDPDLYTAHIEACKQQKNPPAML